MLQVDRALPPIIMHQSLENMFRTLEVKRFFVVVYSLETKIIDSKKICATSPLVSMHGVKKLGTLEQFVKFEWSK